MRYIDKDLDSIQETRNLLLNAQLSFVQLQKLSQSELDEYSASFIAALQKEADTYISDFIKGNDYGNEEDEQFLCYQFLQRFQETIQQESYVGIINGNVDNQLIEIGVPLGVVVAVLPSHPTFSLLVNLVLLAMKSGNALVVVANKRSKSATIDSFKCLIALSEKCGFPEGSIAIAEIITDSGIMEVLRSDKVSLIVNIGCPEYITEQFQTNTSLIYGGEASGPVFIERTADIEQAVKDVIHSRSFHNGILPGAEQFLVTENVIADQIKQYMLENGAYILDESETQKLREFLERSQKNITNSYIGKSAVWLAKMAGFTIPETTSVLVSLQDYMNEEDFLNQKLLCPIILVYLEPDWTLACIKCMSLLAELKMGHTLTIHSTDWKVIREFATVKSVGRIVVNAPTVCAATGITSNFSPSLILGGITTGRGYSSENMTPKSWTYTRQVGFKITT
ncbi:aldehyde dehydrogenase family protein [Streptococcus sp. ZJ93]|uniref:aldehyde dehydrogenase family protein n=1 Tax=Streptococcus handemini TaxID=3161188 RepID=UPI0032F001A2